VLEAEAPQIVNRGVRIPVRMQDALSIPFSMEAPRGVLESSYVCSVPLIRPSRLTTRDRGGVGKNLSEGWCINFAVGCTHACPFCYVDSIHKRFGRTRYGDAVLQDWGNYLLIPSNLPEAIEETPWHRWSGKEVMMSSTHDPYLPKLAAAARQILEHALPAGVRFCLQTRSFLVTRDFDLLAEYADLVRLQISIATLSEDLARKIEPRVPSPARRLEVLARASEAGLTTGVIVAPIFPACRARPDIQDDLRRIAESIAPFKPKFVYGETLHVRGENLRLTEEAIGERPRVSPGFDQRVARLFLEEMHRAGLSATWWPNH